MEDPDFTTREQIEAVQLSALRGLLSEVAEHNPFQKCKLGGVAVKIDSLDEFQERVSFTTKQEIAADQLESPPYGTNLTYPLDRYTRFHQTSGTTKTPIRWLDTSESWQWMLDLWKQVLKASDVVAGDRVMFAFSFGPFLGFWTAFEAAAQSGCLCISGGGQNSAARLAMMAENEANVLCCTPTYALRLAEAAATEKLDLHALEVKSIIVAGEPGGSIPATRAAIETAWSPARVYDHHGMTEVGPVSFECPARRGVLHVIESGFIPEVIDPRKLSPVAKGETGELVLTPLGRPGMPVLRYRTGDLVKTATDEVCKCGRSDLALDGGILGRVDDMIVVRGVNVYPAAVEQIIRGCGGVAEYRVNISTERGMDEMGVRVEAAAGHDGESLARSVRQAMQRELGLRVEVEAAWPGTLERFEMKAKRWRRGVGERKAGP